MRKSSVTLFGRLFHMAEKAPRKVPSVKTVLVNTKVNWLLLVELRFCSLGKHRSYQRHRLVSPSSEPYTLAVLFYGKRASLLAASETRFIDCTPSEREQAQSAYTVTR